MYKSTQKARNKYTTEDHSHGSLGLFQKAALVISLVLNSIFVLFWYNRAFGVALPPSIVLTKEQEHDNLQTSKYAQLERTIPRPWLPSTLEDEAAQQEIWENQTNYDLGIIALEDTEARSLGLPRSQRFPWDDSKGIYLINAYHNLHCVKALRTALVEYRSNMEQTLPWLHLAHCLNVLREEIICDASDVPRYTGYQPNQASGLGQTRMCRDWGKLEAWSREHTGCWRHIDRTGEDFNELERYRFCPPGSEYEDASRKGLSNESDVVLRSNDGAVIS